MTKDQGKDLSQGKTYQKNILLTGIMGSGKTSVGKILARIMGLGFIDLDQLIEKEARSTISQIFSKQGEEKFRALEK